jgi:hypothetical protein
MVAPAEELPASLMLLVPSLSEIVASLVEIAVSLETNRGNPMSTIATTTTKSSLYTSTSCSGDYIIGELWMEDSMTLYSVETQQ